MKKKAINGGYLVSMTNQITQASQNFGLSSMNLAILIDGPWRVASDFSEILVS